MSLTTDAIEKKRFNMIEQQIRPWDVLDQGVLNLLTLVKREDYVPEVSRALAFGDFEIPLPGGQHMLTPKVEARVIQDLNVKKREMVLEIGTGSGYMAALLAYRASKVITVEIDPALAAAARERLRANGVDNVEVVTGDGARGWPDDAPAAQYDIIAVSGGLPVLPERLLRQLKIGGRLSAFVGYAPVMQAQLVTRVSEGEFHVVNSFDTYVTPLRNALAPSNFKF